MSNEQTPRESESKYAKKVRAKYGRGAPDPRWMWWKERPEERAQRVAEVHGETLEASNG